MKYADYPTFHEIASPRPWADLSKEKQATALQLSLRQKSGEPFWFNLTPGLLKLLSQVDEFQGYFKLRPTSRVRSTAQETVGLKAEAYHSSRIEGAVTSLELAFKAMDSGQKSFPDESLQMIQNNKRGIAYLWQNSKKAISHKLICRLHEILVYHTHLDRPITVGAYRQGSIYVVDGYGRVIYEGPPARHVPKMMDAFVEWANHAHPGVHPFLKSAIAHYYFVHVHPFDDGNGRSTRALANLLLFKDGYALTKLIAPSMYIERHRSAYYQSLQDVRAHFGDLTYFLIYIAEAFVSELGRVKSELEKPSAAGVAADLNPRQVKALRYMQRQCLPMTTRLYVKLNRCSDEIARRDFNRLLAQGVLKAEGEGRSRRYRLA